MDPKENLPLENEPSVLDYLKAKLRFWERSEQPLSPSSGIEKPNPLIENLAETTELGSHGDQARDTFHRKFPWFLILSVTLAILAQLLLEPVTGRSAVPGIILYSLSAICLIIAIVRKRLVRSEHRDESNHGFDLTLRVGYFIPGLIFSIMAFFLFKSGQFNFLNTLLWIVSIFLIGYSLSDSVGYFASTWEHVKGLFNKGKWHLELNSWLIVVIGTILLVVFFRFAQINQVPGEMIGDQAERLLAANDIQMGSDPIFSSRNNGSEIFQYYWTDTILRLTGTQLSFFAMKLASAIAGVVTLIYIYLLGKEVADRWVGILAVIFCGIAYWSNVLARSFLGGIFVPLFMSAMLYYLVKGLRLSKRNYFIAGGVALGLGLLSYRVFLVAPLVILLAIGLYCVHKQSKGKRLQALWGILILFLIGLIVFSPMLRVIVSEPRVYFFKVFSRLAEWERPYPGNGWSIFLKNLWSGITMFFWSNGNQWVESVVNRPALDFVSGGLLMVGVFLTLWNYYNKRHWLDLFLVLSVIILLLPSILSIAFPEENPSMSQASGAMVPVFILVAIAIYQVIRNIEKGFNARWNKHVGVTIALVLIILSASQNYKLVFRQYKENYLASAMNTSEIAGVLTQFDETIGSYETAWVMGFPHWVDTKLVAIVAGRIGDDFAMFSERLPETVISNQAKMFLLNKLDADGLDALQTMYPEGTSWEYTSVTPEKNFLIFFVPPAKGVTN
jgi:4-amino-4-deoxy-L-arabinose transferase-like glycosyltransferase